MSKAMIYRKAAQFIERSMYPEEVGGWSCLAIAKAACPAYTGYWVKDGFSSDDLPEVQRYAEVYELGDNHWFDDEGHRVIALCLMAAMVEAGDA